MIMIARLPLKSNLEKGKKNGQKIIDKSTKKYLFVKLLISYHMQYRLFSCINVFYLRDMKIVVANTE